MRKVKKLFLRRLGGILLAGCLPQLFLQAAELPGGGQQQEYFVRQLADQGLLIRISGREAQFESRVATIDDEVILASAVPGSRLAPLFQYIPPADRDRQLDIRVLAPFDTNRSEFSMGLSRVDVRDDRSARLAQGYQSLSFGLELPGSDTAANWSVKVNALLTAARVFDGFGMVELALWSRFYGAQLTLSELGDHNAALLLLDQIAGDQALRRFDDMRLAVLRLRAESLSVQRRAGELAPRTGAADPVQVAAEQMAALAASLGNLYERSEALYLAATDLDGRGLGQDALEKFESALELAVAIEADDLATRIRERMVAIHGDMGDVAASSQVLQAIESQLAEDGADDELAQNLLAQGRILNRTYRFAEAQTVLRQALEFEHNSLTRSRIRLELADANYALGALPEARAQAMAAVSREGDDRYLRPTPLLDIGRGIGILAGVERATGGSDLRAIRDAQQAYLETREQRLLWRWERAQDELRDGPSSAAVPWLQPLLDARNIPALAPYAERAQLWLCRLATSCPAGAAQNAARVLERHPVPIHRIAGAWLYAEWLREQGQLGRSAAAYEALLDEAIFIRFSIPGALGHWHWRRSAQITRGALTVFRSLNDPARHLLALARVRWLQASGDGSGIPFDRLSAGLDTDTMRALLARTEQPEPGDDKSALLDELGASLEGGRQRFRAAANFLSAEGQARWLASLQTNEGLLAYDLAADRAYALLGSKAGVQRVALGGGAFWDSWAGLLTLGQGAVSASDAEALLNQWGERLLGPLRTRLPDRVYLAASGALATAPLELLRTSGTRPLAGRQLVRLASYPARPGPAGRLQLPGVDRVFLAGLPQDFSAGFLERLEAGAELSAVMDVYRGPGLQVVQGSALLPDEFATDALSQAQVVHLAMPAWIDLDAPGRSYLELSEIRRGAGRLRQDPGQLAAWTLSAGLSVISQARLHLGQSAGAVRPPLISDLLSAGSASVLASGWQADDQVSAQFFSDFHGALMQGQSVTDALEYARAQRMAPGGESLDWARYQLWLD